MATYELVGKGTKRNSNKVTRDSVKFVYKGIQYNHILPLEMEINGKVVELGEVDFNTYARHYIETSGLSKVGALLGERKKETPEERAKRLSDSNKQSIAEKEKYAALPLEMKQALKSNSIKGVVESLIEHGVITDRNAVNYDNISNYM